MKKSLGIAIPVYLIGLAILSVYLVAEIHPRVFLNPAGRLILLCTFCLLTFIGSRQLAPHNKRLMKYTLWLYFILYMSLLINFTLLDIMFSRRGTWIFADPVLLKIYLNNSVNILPFSTIFEYIRAIFQHTQSLIAIATNLFGNLLALMPMALFLPVLVKGCQKMWLFLLVTAATVITIELLQFAFAVGFCDIDDLILNISGAALAFWVFRCRPVKTLLQKVLLMEYP